jgi:hypothetical protein
MAATPRKTFFDAQGYWVERGLFAVARPIAEGGGPCGTEFTELH